MVEAWKEATKGEDIGISKLSLIIMNVITAVVAAFALIVKFVK